MLAGVGKGSSDRPEWLVAPVHKDPFAIGRRFQPGQRLDHLAVDWKSIRLLSLGLGGFHGDKAPHEVDILPPKGQRLSQDPRSRQSGSVVS
jgi:hypothetical protein